MPLSRTVTHPCGGPCSNAAAGTRSKALSPQSASQNGSRDLHILGCSFHIALCCGERVDGPSLRFRVSLGMMFSLLKRTSQCHTITASQWILTVDGARNGCLSHQTMWWCLMVVLLYGSRLWTEANKQTVRLDEVIRGKSYFSEYLRMLVSAAIIDMTKPLK